MLNSHIHDEDNQVADNTLLLSNSSETNWLS
jgi:hypothetical protein